MAKIRKIEKEPDKEKVAIIFGSSIHLFELLAEKKIDDEMFHRIDEISNNARRVEILKSILGD